MNTPGLTSAGKPERGTALLVVLILLALLALCSAATFQAVVMLKRELREIERVQQRKFEAPAHRPP